MENGPRIPPACPDDGDLLPPGDCRTMDEVRRQVDLLDRRLVRLLARRQGYIEAAARIKTDRSSVRDANRVEQVVANVVACGEEAGLSPAIAEPVWRELIERSIEHELDLFDALDRRQDGAE